MTRNVPEMMNKLMLGFIRCSLNVHIIGYLIRICLKRLVREKEYKYDVTTRTHSSLSLAHTLNLIGYLIGYLFNTFSNSTQTKVPQKFKNGQWIEENKEKDKTKRNSNE